MKKTIALTKMGAFFGRKSVRASMLPSGNGESGDGSRNKARGAGLLFAGGDSSRGESSNLPAETEATTEDATCGSDNVTSLVFDYNAKLTPLVAVPAAVESSS